MVDAQLADGLHTGDDDLLDALTSARVAIESISDGDDDTAEAVQHALDVLTEADEIRVRELCRSPSLKSQCAGLLDALRDFGRHSPSCAMNARVGMDGEWSLQGDHCSCGLFAAIARAEDR
jgi:hypothetical protein